jgi:hypothetical protein
MLIEISSLFFYLRILHLIVWYTELQRSLCVWRGQSSRWDFQFQRVCHQMLEAARVLKHAVVRLFCKCEIEKENASPGRGAHRGIGLPPSPPPVSPDVPGVLRPAAFATLLPAPAPAPTLRRVQLRVREAQDTLPDPLLRLRRGVVHGPLLLQLVPVPRLLPQVSHSLFSAAFETVHDMHVQDDLFRTPDDEFVTCGGPRWARVGKKNGRILYIEF